LLRGAFFVVSVRFRYNDGMYTSSEGVPERPKRAFVPRTFAVLIAIIVFVTWLLYTPDGLLGKADAVGYALCHRIDLRSFQLGTRQMPLCARCTGMYLGVLIGLGFYITRRTKAGRYPDKAVSAALICFAAIWAVDGLNSYLQLLPMASGVYHPSNMLRLITGTLVGISLATLVYPAFSQFSWKDAQNEPVLRSFKDLGLLLLIAAILVAFVLDGNPLVLYPLAVASTLSAFLILTIVYTSVVLAVSRRENRAERWRDLFTPIVIGLTLAVIQIGAIDLLRYTLTGTWAGFHF
jgi:uncharacterized membrane protein